MTGKAASASRAGAQERHARVDLRRFAQLNRTIREPRPIRLGLPPGSAVDCAAADYCSGYVFLPLFERCQVDDWEGNDALYDCKRTVPSLVPPDSVASGCDAAPLETADDAVRRIRSGVPGLMMSAVSASPAREVVSTADAG
jgi:hypothetical protein